MKQRSAFLFIFLLWTAVSAASDTRDPWAAGSFYPADKKKLTEMVDHFISRAKIDLGAEEPLIILAPHAGYPFSGSVAGASYRLLKGKHYDTVILLGPCHHTPFPGASVWTSGDWVTPLGTVPVDRELAKKIQAEDPSFSYSEEAHQREHSLEAQLPFLQRTLTDFKIVPIVLNDMSAPNVRKLAQAIYKNIRGLNAIVIVSTDMSHYRSYEKAKEVDGKALDILKQNDSFTFLDAASSGQIEFCGEAAVATALELSHLYKNTRVEVIHYANSGDTTANKTKVVGYGAVAFYKTSALPPAVVSPEPSLAPLPPPPPVPAEEAPYTEKEKNVLLEIARDTIETYVVSGEMPAFPVNFKKLQEKRAVFVTLKKHGELRGCVGSLVAEDKLYEAVRQMAVKAATEDPRFPPVKLEELEFIKIEISILSPSQRIENSDAIQMGRDGVVIKKGAATGVFLPKVAEETGWKKEQFLNELCSQKAGLPENCWQDPDTELYTFSSFDFGEPSD